MPGDIFDVGRNMLFERFLGYIFPPLVALPSKKAYRRYLHVCFEPDLIHRFCRFVKLVAVSVKNMEYFIESVRKYPCLWKMDTNDYKNNELKKAA